MRDPAFLTVLSMVMLPVFALLLVLHLLDVRRWAAFGVALGALIACVMSFSVVSVLRQVLGPDYAGRVALLGVTRVAVICVGLGLIWLVVRERRRRP